MNIIDLLSGGSIPNTQNHEHYDPMYLDLVGGRFQGDGMIQPEVIESAVENNTKIGEEERRLISIILTQLVTSDQLAPIWDQLTLIVNCSQSIARKIKLNDDSDRIWVVPDIN